MSGLIEFIDNLSIRNLKFVLNTCNAIDANGELSGEIMKKAIFKADGLLVSSPRRDRFGQIFFTHGRVCGSEFAGKISNICKAKSGGVDFICLDGTHSNWSEIYLDKKAIMSG